MESAVSETRQQIEKGRMLNTFRHLFYYKMEEEKLLFMWVEHNKKKCQHNGPCQSREREKMKHPRISMKKNSTFDLPATKTEIDDISYFRVRYVRLQHTLDSIQPSNTNRQKLKLSIYSFWTCNVYAFDRLYLRRIFQRSHIARHHKCMVGSIDTFSLCQTNIKLPTIDDSSNSLFIQNEFRLFGDSVHSSANGYFNIRHDIHWIFYR